MSFAVLFADTAAAAPAADAVAPAAVPAVPEALQAVSNVPSRFAAFVAAQLTKRFDCVHLQTPSERWIAFAVGVAASLILAALIDLIIRKVLKRFARRTKTELDDKVVDALEYPLVAVLTLSGTYACLGFLNLSGFWIAFAYRCYLALVIAICLSLALRIVRIIGEFSRGLATRTGNTYHILLLSLLQPLCAAILWVIGTLCLLDYVFGFNIGALLAGAGIAAMAIAFAAQNTIANIFGAISLILDRPFEIGQRIQVGDKSGVVESIGLRSTRLRTLDGTVWCIPNRTMTDTAILNFSTRPNFKHIFTITLTYSTSPDALRRGKEILHSIFDNYPLFNMEKQPPRITFSEMADCSLNLQVLCWFQTTDFFAFTQAKEEITFRILEEFNKAGLDFAFPSRSIYIESMPAPKA